MAWDDPPDPCNSCILWNGFDGTEEEATEAVKFIVCEGKKDCLKYWEPDEVET